MNVTISLLAAGLLVAASALPAQAADPARPDATLVIDWTRDEGTVNRPLFSTQGFMQIYTQHNPLVLDTFELLNPRGTQTRLETYIHQMEPENDNDDPAVFDWSRLHPDTMVRFIDDRAAFERVYRDELGMETLSLLCYNAGWNQSGVEDRPLKSNEEWAEFAAAVVESYNGPGNSRGLNLRYVQVWNEPNMAMFYTGTPQSYYDLFNTVATRIHREYPGVMVGGPTITHSGRDPEGWIDGFIRECGANADFLIFHHYGPQGEGHQVLVDSVRDYATRLRAIPGRENARVMITETDGWFQGWPKTEFILDRQYAFLGIDDLLLGVHHFCCLAYNESGNYVFGIVDEQGGVIPGVFNPYWLFRNHIGRKAYIHTSGPRMGNVQVVASHDTTADSFLANAVLRNRGEAGVRADVRLLFPPADRERVLAMDTLTADGIGPGILTRVAAGQADIRIPLDLEPGMAAGLTLREDGRRHFAFRDLNNQEHPWVAARTTSTSLGYRESASVTVRVVNTLLRPVSGRLELRGLPAGWSTGVLDGEPFVESLEPGATHEIAFHVDATKLVDAGQTSAFAVLVEKSQKGDEPLESLAHSIPVTFLLPRPLAAQELPLPVLATAGADNVAELQLTNMTVEPISGTVTMRLPAGITSRVAMPVSFSLAAKERRRFTFPIAVGKDVAAGDHAGEFEVAFLDATMRRPLTVNVSEPAVKGVSRPVDLSAHLNFDPLSFAANPTNVDDMGMFFYPADMTPSGREVTARGLRFLMPAIEDGRKCAVLPKGQRIDVPAGVYTAVAFVGFGHDGKHPGTWTLHYADGTSAAVQSEIPEWCSTPPEGTFAVFNAPHRLLAHGTAGPACQFWAWTIPVDTGKTLVAVELPTFERGAYVFAMSVVE